MNAPGLLAPTPASARDVRARDVRARNVGARIPRADPDDPRFRGLPFADGIPRRFVPPSPTIEAAEFAEGVLLGTGWAVHRMGRARYAHGPNGARWLFAFRVDGLLDPAWMSRLEAERTTTPPGASPEVGRP